MARFNLNRAQATTLASQLLDALEQNHEDAIEVPPAYDYQGEFTRVLAKGLGLTQAEVTEGLGLRGAGGQQLSRTRSFIRFSELESLSLDMIRWLVT
jgi:hypothetical protein